LDEKIKKATELHKKLVAEEREKVQAWEAAGRSATVRNRDLKNEIDRAREVVRALPKLRQEQERLESNTCPTCEQTWVKGQKRLALVKDEILKLEAVEAGIEAKNAQYWEWHDEQEQNAFVFNPQVHKLNDAREALIQKRQAAATDAKSKSLEILLDQDNPAVALSREEAELSKAVLASDRTLQELRAAKTRVQAYDEHYQQLVKQHKMKLVQAQAKLDLGNEAVAMSESLWAQEADYETMLKGFRNKIFDEVLQSVGAEATNIIATLPNAQHIAVEFRSEKETQKQTVQERITPYVTIYGTERPLHDALSGGQLTSLGLAVDLAIFRVVGSRMGSRMNWLVFDEAFDGQDPITKIACLEMLQQYAADKLILIVDHTSEFKELFSQTIVVEYSDQKSRIA
jgi:DNA repair exonuclease SbcCD ATPase subunit